MELKVPLAASQNKNNLKSPLFSALKGWVLNRRHSSKPGRRQASAITGPSELFA
jgi:hypothetical protein